MTSSSDLGQGARCAASDTTALQCEGLRYTIGARTILDSVDLAVQRGSALAVTGPSGSGKTTPCCCAWPGCCSRRPVALAVFNPGGRAGVDAIKQVVYTSMTSPYVRVVADDSAAATAVYAGLVDWLLDFALAGMVALTLAGTLAAAGIFVAQSRELGPLAGFRADRRLYLGIAAWNLAIPLAVAALCGAGTAAVLAVLLTNLAPHGRFSVGFLATTLAMALLVAAAVGAVCGQVAARAARSWRPTAD